MATNNVRDVLKSRRLEKKITAEKLGKLVGVNKTTIYRYENGEIGKMPVEVATKIAKVLEINPLFIAGFVNDPSIQNEVTGKNSYESEVNLIMDKLDTNRKSNVFVYATKQLEEQNKVVDLPQFNDEGTLAAHSAEHDKTFDDKEVDKINSYLDKLDEEYDAKNKL